MNLFYCCPCVLSWWLVTNLRHPSSQSNFLIKTDTSTELGPVEFQRVRVKKWAKRCLQCTFSFNFPTISNLSFYGASVLFQTFPISRYGKSPTWVYRLFWTYFGWVGVRRLVQFVTPATSILCCSLVKNECRCLRGAAVNLANIFKHSFLETHLSFPLISALQMTLVVIVERLSFLQRAILIALALRLIKAIKGAEF